MCRAVKVPSPGQAGASHYPTYIYASRALVRSKALGALDGLSIPPRSKAGLGLGPKELIFFF